MLLLGMGGKENDETGSLAYYERNHNWLRVALCARDMCGSMCCCRSNRMVFVMPNDQAQFRA